jgi:hypothetical protein
MEIFIYLFICVAISGLLTKLVYAIYLTNRSFRIFDFKIKLPKFPKFKRKEKVVKCVTEDEIEIKISDNKTFVMPKDTLTFAMIVLVGFVGMYFLKRRR